MSLSPTIVWFRQDLRLADNPALHHALCGGEAVVPLYIWSPDEEGQWSLGSASRWWLHHSLKSLGESLRSRGSKLVVRKGNALEVLREIIAKTGAGSVVWNRRYESASIGRDMGVKQALLDDGIDVRSFNGSLLASPISVRNQSGKPFKVFTPFWRHVSGLPARSEIEVSRTTFPAPEKWPRSTSLVKLGLLPSIAWDREFYEHWEPGEAGALKALNRFLDEKIDGYARHRDNPAEEGTSRLSPHLRFGEVSPVQIQARVAAHGPGHGADVFMSEVAWREFGYHLMFHFPHTATEPLRPEFERFPWSDDAALLNAWRRGRTGYPIVDAGMRQLWRTGWMHNRVRMIVASFLVKHLLLPWQEGAAWFWDTLVDADLASNTLGWQWSAGCGADAAPYFRVFNPILQGRKFDSDGTYVKRWVPELSDVPKSSIHAPWELDSTALSRAGVVLGETYPMPVVEHRSARKRALSAYGMLKDSA